MEDNNVNMPNISVVTADDDVTYYVPVKRRDDAMVRAIEAQTKELHEINKTLRQIAGRLK